MTTYKIYCDGSCMGNPGPGAWAFAVVKGDAHPQLHGGYVSDDTTNNRAELLAAINAFQWVVANLQAGDKVTIVADSQYMLNAIFVWGTGWEKSGWRKSDGNPVSNAELVKEGLLLARQISAAGIELSKTWVKAHAGNVVNEMVDQHARAIANNGGVIPPAPVVVQSADQTRRDTSAMYFGVLGAPRNAPDLAGMPVVVKRSKSGTYHLLGSSEKYIFDAADFTAMRRVGDIMATQNAEPALMGG